MSVLSGSRGPSRRPADVGPKDPDAKSGALRIAVVGTGISGLFSAYLLRRHHEVTVFEADDRAGGHANTVTVSVPEGELAVDTGFIVYNERTYPGLVRLLAELDVATQPSDMSFSLRNDRWASSTRGPRPTPSSPSGPTWPGPSSGACWPTWPASTGGPAGWWRWSPGPTTRWPTCWPRAGGPRGSWTGTWSRWARPSGRRTPDAPPDARLVLARFFERHGMLSFGDKPAWRTVTGGSRAYVDAIVAPLARARRLRLGSPVASVVRTDAGVVLGVRGQAPETFDHVVLATHSDQALGVLDDATVAEKEVLGAIAYQPNQAVLHSDGSLLPTNRRARAAWNYRRPAHGPGGLAAPTYDMNRLQSLPTTTPVLVSLNQAAIDRRRVLDTSTTPTRCSMARPWPPSAATPRSAGSTGLLLRRLLGARVPRGRPAERAHRLPPPGRAMVTGSALYDCSVVHQRFGPVEHRFTRPVLMPSSSTWPRWPRCCASHPLWSDRRPAPVRFDRRDYLGPADVSLDEAVRALVAERSGRRPTGPVRGCSPSRGRGAGSSTPSAATSVWTGTGRTVEAMVAEVTNTPWKERHAYVVGGPGTHQLDKALHVSPFFPMAQTYRLTYSAPAERLHVSITVSQAGQPVLRASIDGRRRPLDRAALGRLARSPRRTSPGVDRRHLPRSAGPLAPGQGLPPPSRTGRRPAQPTGRRRLGSAGPWLSRPPPGRPTDDPANPARPARPPAPCRPPSGRRRWPRPRSGPAGRPSGSAPGAFDSLANSALRRLAVRLGPDRVERSGGRTGAAPGRRGGAGHHRRAARPPGGPGLPGPGLGGSGRELHRRVVGHRRPDRAHPAADRPPRAAARPARGPTGAAALLVGPAGRAADPGGRSAQRAAHYDLPGELFDVMLDETM